MERRPFGSMQRDIPAVGQGTWYIDDAHRPTAVAALRRGLDVGMTHIDTAEMYGDAEDVVSEAIAGRREEVSSFPRSCPAMLPAVGQRRPVSGRSRACVPIGWTATFCIGPARTRSRTLSPPSSGSVSRARSSPGASATSTCPTSKRPGRPEARALSPVTRFSTIWKSARSSTPCCLGVKTTVSSPLPIAHTGMATSPARRSPGRRVLEEIAATYGATARQVALRFLMRRPTSFTIPKASSPEHAADNAGAGELRLTVAELSQIDAAFPLGPRPSRLPML